MRCITCGTALAAATALLLTACTTSPESLIEDGQDLAGVVRIEARENGGSDGFPFAQIPTNLAVLMEPDATADEIKAVFDEYADEIDDGVVDSVTVTVNDAAQATLAAGEEIQPSAQMIELLVEAANDDRVTSYLHEAFPVNPTISIALTGLGFADVAAITERYRSLAFVDGADARSGPFYVGRDVDDDRARVEARLRLAAEVDRRFGLTGASVTDVIPLDLYVAPADLAAARAFVVDKFDHAVVGQVTVGAKRGA